MKKQTLCLWGGWLRSWSWIIHQKYGRLRRRRQKRTYFRWLTFAQPIHCDSLSHSLSEKMAGKRRNVFFFFICVNCVLIIQFRELKFTRTQPNHIKSRPNVLRSSVHLSTALNDYILSIQLHSITFSNLSSNNQSSCKEICVWCIFSPPWLLFCWW